MQKNSLGYLVWIGFAALLLSGYAGLSALDLRHELKQEPLILDVAPIQQSLGTSCGEAAITMVVNFTNPGGPINESEVIEYAAEQGYYTEASEPFTSPANMVRIARHYSQTVESGHVLSAEAGLKLIHQNLQAGKPVIIDVPVHLSDSDSSAHFVVINGLSVDTQQENSFIIHYIDPLTGRQETASWSGEAGIWYGWMNNTDPGGSGWWLVLS